MAAERIHTVRTAVERETVDRGQRNRLWWESMPMSYADWNAEDRIPKNAEEYRAIEDYVLAKGPFLRHYFAANRFDRLDVLDLGCGVGVLSCLMARQGATVTATDITERAVALTVANARFQKQAVRVVRADAEHLAFADGAFDFVLSWGVVHHTPDTERALAEVARVLKPGGRGLIMVYHKASLTYYLRGLYWLVFRGKLFRGYGLEMVQNFCVDGYYHRHFRRHEFAACISRVGLAVVRLTATQQVEPILPLIPAWLDRRLKERFGWYLVAEVERRAVAK